MIHTRTSLVETYILNLCMQQVKFCSIHLVAISACGFATLLLTTLHLGNKFDGLVWLDGLNENASPVIFFGRSTKSLEMPVVIYNRIPKTGSSSLMDWLFVEANLTRCSTDIGDFGGFGHHLTPSHKAIIARAISNKSYGCVQTGHFIFLDDVAEHTVWINMVRHPVSRLYSQLTFDTKRRYNQFKDATGNEPVLQDCLDVLRTGVGFSDFYCQTIEASLVAESGILLRYFCGSHQGCETRSLDWRMTRAKRNIMKNYAAIGMLEHPEESMALFRSLLKIDATSSMSHYNPSATAINHISVNSSTFLHFFPGNEHDIKLYNFIGSQFCNRLRLLKIRLVNCTTHTYTSR